MSSVATVATHAALAAAHGIVHLRVGDILVDVAPWADVKF